MEMRSFWEDNSLQQHVKFESNSNDNIPPRSREPYYCEAANLNFATGDDDCMDYAYRKTQVRVSRQDPMSHRIIEKRRRDRMNNCLADLSRLIPAEYLKKGRGRVEKTEIIEMAIKHMKHLQYLNHYRLGYQECVSETMRFMVEVEGRYPRESFCVRLLGHLQQHCDNICRGTTEPQMPAMATDNASIPTGTNTEPKVEPNNNYEHEHEHEHHHESTNGLNEIDVVSDEKPECASTMQDHGGNGYKYKNDIKLRFSQEKKPKLSNRRNSTPISMDNQTCSSIGSPTPIHNEIPMKPQVDHDHAAPPWTLGNLTPASNDHNGNTHHPQIQRDVKSPLISHHLNGHDKLNFCIPAFILHTKGSYYIPITLDYQTVLPHLGGYDLLGSLSRDVVLHPIAINVKFQQQPLNLQQPKKAFDSTLPN